MGDPDTEKRRLFEQEALPHLNALFTAALYLTRNEDEANDLCQEAMLRGYRFFHQFTVGTNCRAWLLTILRNIFRTRRSHPRPEQLMATEEEFERAVDSESLKAVGSSVNPEAIAVERNMGGHLQKALDALPEEFKVALILVDIEGLKYEEAAKILEVPIGTVRSRISRGRALMRDALEPFTCALRSARGTG
jgi:RNA polymerase sigma-70 factor, ECF subfamily